MDMQKASVWAEDMARLSTKLEVASKELKNCLGKEFAYNSAKDGNSLELVVAHYRILNAYMSRIKEAGQHLDIAMAPFEQSLIVEPVLKHCT